MVAAIFEKDTGFNVLGYAMNVVDPDQGPPEPFNATLIFDRLILEKGPMVKMSQDTKQTQVGVSGPSQRTVDVPSNVEVFSGANASDGDVKAYNSGSEVDTALSADASFSASYMGVTIKGGVDYSASSHFKQDSMYAFQRYKHPSYSAKISKIQDFLNADAQTAACALPDWVTDETTRTQAEIDAYTKFFHDFGSHVITSVEYGWSFQLEVESSKFEGENKEKLTAYVKAEYLGSSASASTMTSEDRKQYAESSNAHPIVLGGDETIASVYFSNPTDMDARKAWQACVAKAPNQALIDVNMVSIGDIYADSADSALVKAGNNIKAALAPLQGVCRRWCTLRQKDTKNTTLTVSSAGAHIENAQTVIFGIAVKLPTTINQKTISITPGDSPQQTDSTISFDIVSKNLTQVTVHLNVDENQDIVHVFNEEVDFSVGRKATDGSMLNLQQTSLRLVASNSDPAAILGRQTDFTFDVKPELDYWWQSPA